MLAESQICVGVPLMQNFIFCASEVRNGRLTWHEALSKMFELVKQNLPVQSQQ